MILRLLRQRGFVVFRELGHHLEASPTTLRRDLNELKHAGCVVPVRGWSRLPERPDTGLREPAPGRSLQNAAAKRAIGLAAAALCRHGESVIIDGGSTTLQMCPHLASLQLQVLSNCLRVINALLAQPTTRVAIPAGAVCREQNIILSPFENDGMGTYRASRIFMGAAAVGRHGVMQSNPILVQTEQRLLARADELVLLVDSSKFQAPAGHVICALREVDVVVTDAGIAEADARMIRDSGARLIVAEGG